MRVAVQKWGNSLAVRIPRALAEEVGIERGSQVELAVEQGRLVAAPLRPRASRYTLDELLAQVTDENVHDEVDFGPPVGKERW
ncbi:MAG TPA: AbrB/MazE/SpoVT family DNA-binding domain-containing protein [Chloroflexota bacterium]|jgi:antitoxin MazE|nr:AbrB/MazE/SpoVT family DNA-binding domain-containing protein [Chloroflexota bacterium]